MSPRLPGTPTEAPRDHHVCPWWVGYLLASPLRRFREDPEAILGPHVEPGMVVVDVGCSMGYFSFPLARMVGPTGRVYCLDVEPRALRTLQNRARRRGLDGIVRIREVSQASLGLECLEGGADLILAAHVVHESRYPRTFLEQCRDALVGRGRLIVLEPRGHVSDAAFGETCSVAREVGFEVVGHRIRRRTMELVAVRRDANSG
jgi:2-polyprenyl-3-methyl-5-hydroxy-6-metoxy-1,4-benzoquinol methylase